MGKMRMRNRSRTGNFDYLQSKVPKCAADKNKLTLVREAHFVRTSKVKFTVLARFGLAFNPLVLRDENISGRDLGVYDHWQRSGLAPSIVVGPATRSCDPVTLVSSFCT